MKLWNSVLRRSKKNKFLYLLVKVEVNICRILSTLLHQRLYFCIQTIVHGNIFQCFLYEKRQTLNKPPLSPVKRTAAHKRLIWPISYFQSHSMQKNATNFLVINSSEIVRIISHFEGEYH